MSGISARSAISALANTDSGLTGLALNALRQPIGLTGLKAGQANDVINVRHGRTSVEFPSRRSTRDAFDILLRQRRPTTRSVPQLQKFDSNDGVDAMAEEVAAQPRGGIVALPFIDPVDHETAPFGGLNCWRLCFGVPCAAELVQQPCRWRRKLSALSTDQVYRRPLGWTLGGAST